MKVIVVGGGIGGLAAAVGLRRAGHTVKIFERSTFLREVGAAIHVCPNASRVLLAWGFNVQRARMVPVHRTFVARGDDLHRLTETDCSSMAAVYGAPWFLAHRVDLHSELKSLATQTEGSGTPVDIALRAEVVDYNADAGSVTLADGSVHSADLVIAADGVHSIAVSHVTGQVNPAASTGSAAFRFLIPTKEIESDPETSPLLKDGEGTMRIFTHDSGVRRLIWYPCADNTLQNFVAIHPDEGRNDAKEDWDLSADTNIILSEYEGFHPGLLSIIKKATKAKRWPLLYREPIESWTIGRLALIGDAAHPMLPHQGQGGAQAIEDAGALSIIFSNLAAGTNFSEVQSRLRLFQRVRINRASLIQIFSNAGQDESWKIKERAQQLLGKDENMPTSPPEYMAHNFSYDVLQDSREKLDGFLGLHVAK